MMTWDGGAAELEGARAPGKEAKPVSLKDHTADIRKDKFWRKKLFEACLI